MDNNETLAELAEGIRRDGVATSGILIPDGKGAIRAMLPGLPERILAAGKRERDRLMGRIRYLEATNERLIKEATERLAKSCLSCAKVINGDTAAMRKALEAARAALSSYADGGDEDNAETNAVLAEIDAALAAPPRNCDLIANELQIDPDKVPAEINKCENAPIRELIRWIFAKAEGRREISKPTPEESAVAAVARNVAADMRCMELQCWQGRRMGAYAVALMLDGFASRLEDAYNRPPRKDGGHNGK